MAATKALAVLIEEKRGLASAAPKFLAHVAFPSGLRAEVVVLHSGIRLQEFNVERIRGPPLVPSELWIAIPHLCSVRLTSRSNLSFKSNWERAN